MLNTKALTKREEDLVRTILSREGDRNRLLEWADIQQIEKPCSTYHNDWTQLLMGKVKGLIDVAYMPLQDHAKMYQRYDGSRVFISQPYRNKEDIENSMELSEWAESRGLEITLISEELSWHYPGSTVLFQVEIRDKEKYLAYIKENRKRYSIL